MVLYKKSEKSLGCYVKDSHRLSLLQRLPSAWPRKSGRQACLGCSVLTGWRGSEQRSWHGWNWSKILRNNDVRIVEELPKKIMRDQAGCQNAQQHPHFWPKIAFKKFWSFEGFSLHLPDPKLALLAKYTWKPFERESFLRKRGLRGIFYNVPFNTASDDDHFFRRKSDHLLKDHSI